MPITDTARRSSGAGAAPCPRRALGPVAGALLAAQVVHIVAAQIGSTPQAHHQAPGRILHILGLIGTTAVLVAVLRRSPRAALWTTIAGAAVVVAVVVLHLLPLDPSYTNPYYGASPGHWLTIVGLLAAGIAAVAAGRRFGAAGAR